MIAVWLLGITLATLGYHWGESWLHLKLLLRAAADGLSRLGGRLCEEARGGENRRSRARRLRLLNEVPALTLALIVVLVVVKP